MRSIIFYNSVSVKLASWLDSRGIPHTKWLKFLLKEDVDPILMNAAHEMQESYGSADVLNSPIFTKEEFFQTSDIKSSWVSIGKKGNSVYYASNELIARVMVKWIQMNDRAEKFFSDPSAV